MEKYTVIDLFAGAGGLSDGFFQTGKFRLVAAPISICIASPMHEYIAIIAF